MIAGRLWQELSQDTATSLQPLLFLPDVYESLVQHYQTFPADLFRTLFLTRKLFSLKILPRSVS